MVCQTKKSGIEKLDNLVSVCFFINLISVYNMKCKFPPACIFVCCINVSTKIELERNVTFMSARCIGSFFALSLFKLALFQAPFVLQEKSLVPI